MASAKVRSRNRETNLVLLTLSLHNQAGPNGDFLEQNPSCPLPAFFFLGGCCNVQQLDMGLGQGLNLGHKGEITGF